MTSSDVLKSTSLALLLMGPPGGGKTTFMLQFPDLYVLDCDRNLAGPIRYLKSIGKYKPFWYDTISQYESDCTDSFGEHKAGDAVDIKFGWQRLRQLASAALKDPNIHNIGLDTLTWCDTALYMHVCRTQNKKELGSFDWQPYKRELHTFISEVKSSGKNLIVNCHEKIEYDVAGHVTDYLPTVSTNISSYFGYFFSDMWRCTLEPLGNKLFAKVETHPTATKHLKNSLLCGQTIEASYEAVAKFLSK